MRLEDKPKFVLLITTIAEMYHKKISQHLIGLYWYALESFDFNQIRRAFAQHLIDQEIGQYMPKPAEIVRYLEGDYRSRALKAWSKVMRALQSVGTYNSVVFDDPLIHISIKDIGGWTRLGRVLEAELQYCKLEFQRYYMSYLGNKPNEYPTHLPGLIEQQSSSSNHKLSSLVFFGDPDLTKKIYQGEKIQLLLLSNAIRNPLISSLNNNSSNNNEVIYDITE